MALASRPSQGYASSHVCLTCLTCFLLFVILPTASSSTVVAFSSLSLSSVATSTPSRVARADYGRDQIRLGGLGLPSSLSLSLPIDDATTTTYAVVESSSEISDENYNNDDDYDDDEEILTCRIVGFYPFPGGPPRGSIAGYLFRDTHQAILIRSSSKNYPVRSISIDYMTEGGQSNPVWWNESAKWAVLLGGSIRGEIRVRGLPSDYDSVDDADYIAGDSSPVIGPKMRRIVRAARAYDREMNLYRNNCRIFCARMEREVEAINNRNKEGGLVEEVGLGELGDDGGNWVVATTTATTTVAVDDQNLSSSLLLADIRCAAKVVGASLLPAMYPLGTLWLCWEGLRGL